METQEEVEQNIGELQRAANGLQGLAAKWFAGKHPAMGSMTAENISAANKTALLSDAWARIDSAKAALAALEADMPARP